MLHPKLISTPVRFQKPLKRKTSLSKHKLRGPGGKYVSPSEIKRERKYYRGIQVEVRTAESEDSDFECCRKFDGKPVHVDIDKKISGGNNKNLALALLLKSKKDESSKIVEIGVGKIL